MKAKWIDPRGLERYEGEVVDQATTTHPVKGEATATLIRYPAREGFNREYYELELWNGGRMLSRRTTLEDGRKAMAHFRAI